MVIQYFMFRCGLNLRWHTCQNHIGQIAHRLKETKVVDLHISGNGCKLIGQNLSCDTKLQKLGAPWGPQVSKITTRYCLHTNKLFGRTVRTKPLLSLNYKCKHQFAKCHWNFDWNCGLCFDQQSMFWPQTPEEGWCEKKERLMQKRT